MPAVAVDMNVILGAITSSPAVTPSTCSDTNSAIDPFETAIACFVPTVLAKFSSNCATLGPWQSQPERTTSAAACGSESSNHARQGDFLTGVDEQPIFLPRGALGPHALGLIPEFEKSKRTQAIRSGLFVKRGTRRPEGRGRAHSVPVGDTHLCRIIRFTVHARAALLHDFEPHNNLQTMCRRKSEHATDWSRGLEFSGVRASPRAICNQV